ncbi:TetR/AcrR family transcriptional regulator [Streptomyces lushanensis]|uniref:TetR/AcrR family transcriptional regulator n=1 Tax=Streptomyces lushanensis TaxID=1434255 RepID=UPI000834CC0C|nr:TetR/AcrR family transcriptional regulator [Streptomyces lushanensis]
MRADDHTTALPPSPTLRERRRAAATREIVDAAESHIAEHGSAALSLRAVARSLGMTVQALYHYFLSRDALVTAVIARAYDRLADAVQNAVDTLPADSDTPRMVAAAEGYRAWAIAHPELFQLLYGTPLRNYAAPEGGPTTLAMRRLGDVFTRELFVGFTPSQLAAADVPGLSPALRAHLDGLAPDTVGGLPAAATALLLSAWGHLHGLVVLEVFGHLPFMGDHQAEVFRLSMRNLLVDIRARVPRTAP